MKKLIAILILCCMTAAMMASCSDSGNTSNDVQQTTASQAEETVAETTKPGDVPEIGKMDFGGRDFVINYANWSLHRKYFFAESENGEVVNDAIYARTLKVDEDLNINVIGYTNGATDLGQQYRDLKNVVMAGDTSYDIMLIHNSTSILNYVSETLVMDWNKIPHVDFSKDYWDQSIKSCFEFEGILPYADSDFVLPDVNSMFFNISLIDNYSLDNPYTLVLDGEWTWDKLIEMSGQVSADINGDGIFDDQDQYGFVGEIGWQFGSIPTSCGIYTIETDSDGMPQLSVNSEKMVNLVDKIYKLVKEGNSGFTWEYKQEYDPNWAGTPPVSFDAGKALFYLVPLSLADTFRETDVDFGIIPLPKNDVSQEDYLTLNWAGLMCIPMTVSDPELVGAASELLAYYNREIVVPAFYDILLGQKIARDDDSRKMLDIIFENSVHDLGVNLGGDFYGILNAVVSSGKGDFASHIASKESTLTTTIEKYYNAYVDYSANLG